VPEVELWARTRLTLADDPYLRDHEFRGSFLFPTVFGLEAMAQAAQLLRREPITRIEEIRLSRPIPVDAKHGTLIEVRLLALEDGEDGVTRIRAAIRSEQTGFAQEHFSALLVLGARSVGAVAAAPPSAPALSIAPAVDLYGGVLFQGRRFQRIQSVLALDSQRVLLRATATESEGESEPTSGDAAPRWVLGDPYLRDTLLQSVQLMVPQHVCLPIYIGSLTLHDGKAGSPLLLTGLFHGTTDKEDRFEVIATDESGRAVEHLRDYRLRILSTHPEHPRAEDLARPEGFDEATLVANITGAMAAAGLSPPALALRFLPELAERPPVERHEQAMALLQKAISAPAGKLAVACDDRYCLGAATEVPLGCALLAAQSSPGDAGGAYRESDPLHGELLRGGDHAELAFARLRAGRLSARRLCGEEEAVLEIMRRQGSAVFFRATTASGTCSVLTVGVMLTRGPERVAALAFPLAELSSK